MHTCPSDRSVCVLLYKHSCNTDVTDTVQWSHIVTHSTHTHRKTLLWCPAHPVQHVRPALHGYTLEHRQHGEGKVVEVCDAVVWALPTHFAHCSIIVTVSAISSVRCTRCRLFLWNDYDKRDRKKRQICTSFWDKQTWHFAGSSRWFKILNFFQHKTILRYSRSVVFKLVQGTSTGPWGLKQG